MKTMLRTQPDLIKSVKRYPGVDALYHVAYYHAARVGYQDVISRSLHDFKDSCEPQLSRWIALATPMVCRELKFDLIIRALGSQEESASGKAPLDRLCVAIAEQSGAEYTPERLQKIAPVRALTTLGGRVARQHELEGAYRFYATGLDDAARVLLVDDLATTGATLEAITAAVHLALPNAQVLCFTLARVDPQLQNAHLDQQYFLNGIPPSTKTRRVSEHESMTSPTAKVPSKGPGELLASPARSTQALGSTVRAPQISAPPLQASHLGPSSIWGPLSSPDSVRAPQCVSAPARPSMAPPPSARLTMPSRATAVLRETSFGSLTSVPRPSATASARPKDSVVVSVPRSPRGIPMQVYVGGLLLSLALLGATVLLPAKKDPTGPGTQFVQLVAEKSIQSPDPIPVRRVAASPAWEGRSAVVTVPSTGLRANHSMESRVVPKSRVRNRERVEILRKFSSQLGPDWIQVRTKDGTVGWVVASVIKEVRG